MAVGIRIRDPYTNNIRLDTTDYTTSMYYTQQVYVASSGSLTLSGIDSNNYFAVLVAAIRDSDMFLTYTPRVYISGSTVVWEVGPKHNATTYTLMVFRIA